MISVPPEHWSTYAEADARIEELAFPPSGLIRSYSEAMNDPAWMESVRFEGEEVFPALSRRCRDAVLHLNQTLKEVRPDVVVIISDDQDEWFFDDNMPAFAVYWGDAVQMRPFPLRPGRTGPVAEAMQKGYGDTSFEVPIAAQLGRHIIERLTKAEFDVAHSTYMPAVRGGSVVRRYISQDGATDITRVTPDREVGLPHGFSFVVRNLFDDVPPPIVPVFQNTCYPPNCPTPRRCFRFGEALANAIKEWGSEQRVAIIASGGLSHFVVDEHLDRGILDALAEKDEDHLQGLDPRRMVSATSESLNWVSLGGAMRDTPLEMHLIDYVPVYRTPVGTGGGWAFAKWL